MKKIFLIGLTACMLSGQDANASEWSSSMVATEVQDTQAVDPTLKELLELLGSTEVDRNRLVPTDAMFVCGISTDNEVCLKAMLSCSGVTLSVYDDGGLLVGRASANMSNGQWLIVPMNGMTGQFELVVSLPDGSALSCNFIL